MKRIIKFFLISTALIAFLSLFFFLQFSFAQDRQLEVSYPEIPGAQRPTTTTTPLPAYVKYIFNFGIAIFGLIVLGVLIFGGIKYFLAAGNPAALSEARNQISAAFLGLVFILSSYLILTTINPQLVVFNLLPLPPLNPPYCKNDADCRKITGCEEEGACYCDQGICRGKIEERESTLIVFELPLGQLARKGAWSEDKINQLKDDLNAFDKFLNSEINIESTLNTISDLSKYLVGLTDDCSCDATEGVCTTPETGGGAVGCFGDPCKDVKEKMEKAQEKIAEKIKELSDFKKKIEQRHKISVNEEEKLNSTYEEMIECLKNGRLLKLKDYLDISELFYQRGWKIDRRKNPLLPESPADEFTFYCISGGTVFDKPKVPYFDIKSPAQQNLSSKLSTEEDFLTALGPIAAFCPVPIPVADLFDNISFETLKLNHNLLSLLVGTENLSGSLQELLDSVSECRRKDACTITCAQGPNPCYPGRGTCVQIPFSPNKICCNPLSLPPCLLCVPGVTDRSPNLQVRGGGASCKGNPDPPYNGSPCPQEDLEIILNKINYLDERIRELVKDVKSNLEAKPAFIIETPQGELNLLEGVRGVLEVCKSSENAFVANCPEAIGSVGPDRNIIASCNPGDFFCCTDNENTAYSIRDRVLLRAREGRALVNYDSSFIKGPPVTLTLTKERCSVDYTFTETAQCYTDEEKRQFPKNVEGIAQTWVKLPENFGFYKLYSHPTDRWGNPEFISLIMAISQRFYERYNKILSIDDITGRCAPALMQSETPKGGLKVTHKTHDIGTDADISVDGLTFEQKEKLARMFIECGVDRILYNGPGWKDLQRTFGSNKIIPVKGHETHFHVRFEKRPDYGPKSPPITRKKFGPHRAYKGKVYQ